MEDQERLELNKKNIEAFKKLIDNGMIVEAIKELIQVCSETKKAKLVISRSNDNKQFIVIINKDIVSVNENISQCILEAYTNLISSRILLKTPKRYTL